MDIIAKDSGGANVVAREQAVARWYPDPTVAPATVDIWWRYVSEPVSEARFHGNFPVNVAEISKPHTPDRDENIIVYSVSRGPDGTPSHSALDDAPQVEVQIQRLSSAPLVSQLGASTTEAVTIAVDDPEGRFARKRRISISPNADMSAASTVETDFGAELMPRLVEIARALEDFDPADVAGLAAWFKADAITGLTDGQAVATWPDSSGAGRDATQATSGSRPLYKTNIVNSKPVVRFDGSDDWFSVADHATLELNADSTVFLVVKVTSFAALRSLVSKDAAAASASAYYLHVTTAGKPNLDRPFVEGGVAATSALTAASFHVVTCSVSGTGVSHHKDGATNGTDTLAAGTQTNQPLRLGAINTGSLANFFFGDVAEVVIFNAALSPTDREKVERYLADKYALATSAPELELAQTIYVTVAHSSGGAFGAESEPLELSFASGGGSGGSEGPAELVPRDRYDLV